jgi:two-component system, response regulator YesN
MKGFQMIPMENDTIKQLVNQYVYATGLGCSYIDNLGNLIVHSKLENSSIDDDLIYDIPTSLENTTKPVSTDSYFESTCQKSHLYGAFQAERFGGQYIYFCSLGLVHWCAPVIRKGVMIGALISSHVNLNAPNEFQLDEISHKLQLDSSNYASLKNYIFSTHVVEPKRVTYLSDTLMLFAKELSDETYRYVLNNEQSHHIESEISNHIHFYKTMGGEVLAPNNYPLAKEKQLLRQIALGDHPSSKQLLNELLAEVNILCGGNFQIMKARVLELSTLLSRAALEGGAEIEEVLGSNFKYLNEINTFTQVSQLNEWINKILARFHQTVFILKDVKHIDAMYKAIDYVKRHYMDKITLEEVANLVGFTPPYFSSLFKSEMKTNFNKYVTHLRIEKSKDLLLTPHMSLSDVATQSGFYDQSHFSRHFKAINGLSPSQFIAAQPTFKLTST